MEKQNVINTVCVAVAITVAICVPAVLSTKGSSCLNYITSFVHIIVILFNIVVDLLKSDVKNLAPFAPFGARGVCKASAILFFAYVGFDSVSTMVEETKYHARDIPIGLVGSMAITTTVYCLMVITLCLMQPYTSIDTNAPFFKAFQMAGWNWAQYVVAAGALKGMTSSLLVGVVGQARNLAHISRMHTMPPWFAKVDPKIGTPINATTVLLGATGVIALLTNLDILTNLLSISTFFIFMLVVVAILVRRYYISGEISLENRCKLTTFLAVIVGSSVATAVYWGVGGKSWVGYCVTVPIWILSTAGLWFFVPRARRPQHWGVPLVPWLPSASIAIDIFLLGSIDKDSFMRFGIWTVFLLVYYFFLGLHVL